MPRGSGERRLEDAIDALAKALDRTGAPWMIIGGIAIVAHGVRRLTTDIDAAVQGDAVDVRTLLAQFSKSKIRPRIHDAQAFARNNLILLMRHEPTGVDLDVSLAWSGFERDALQSRTKLAFGRSRVPMAKPEDLVVFKLVAGRPKDIEDAQALVALHPQMDLARARRHLQELASLIEDDALLARWESLARWARATRRKRRPKALAKRVRR